MQKSETVIMAVIIIITVYERGIGLSGCEKRELRRELVTISCFFLLLGARIPKPSRGAEMRAR